MDAPQTLPTGVITFLLTDIEGSTRLWEREPDAMRQALVRHDAIVSACVRRQQGHVVKSKGEGDSVFAVFLRARDAVNAALIVQLALGMEKWPTSVPIRVRMAIHTGHVELRDGDYYGPTVNRCARLRALGKGGQVLISGVTAQLVQSQLPSGGSLRDLGTHQLKDLAAPERVWQLQHPQMAAVLAASAGTAGAAAEDSLRRGYLLTDHANRGADGLEWGAGVEHSAATEEGIRCYASPKLAGLMNPVRERFRLPKVWEASLDRDLEPGEGDVLCENVLAVRQVPLPTMTALDYARFAVLCAQAAYTAGELAVEFSQWAESFMAGMDASGVNARAIADRLEGAASFDEHAEIMAANAARAATHAARTSWLAGRARDEEIARAADLAAEAVGLAMRLAHLDMADLAEKAVKAQAPALSLR